MIKDIGFGLLFAGAVMAGRCGIAPWQFPWAMVMMFGGLAIGFAAGRKLGAAKAKEESDG